MSNKYLIKISGKNPKRFVDYLIKEHISLYHLEKNKDSYTILVDEVGYTKIKKIKTIYKITVIKEYGIIKYKNILKKYCVFFICLFFGFIFLEILSNIIFDIEIEHSKSEIRELVSNDLKQFGIEKYHFVVSYDKKEKIIKKILKKETDKLEWLEIDRVGTKYIVKVEERIKNDIKQDPSTQHIVAKKSAMILEIQAESGEIKVKKKDYVEKGQVLISGFITKDEEIKKKVKAKGTVFGEVWYQVEIDLPRVYKEIEYTNNQKKRLELKFLNKNYLLMDFKKYKTYHASEKEILKNRLLPLELNYATVRETNEKEKRYTGKKGEEAALKLAEQKLKQKLNNNSSILSKKILKKTEKDSKIIIDVFFKVKEDITDIENIDNVDIKKIEGEENGTDD